jgi:hypothetical protein
VTGCDSHDELVGGYVLGALSDEETETMRVHLETCPACAAEYEALAVLPALLDRIEPADVPPPLPSPEVEEAILDRFAHERRPSRAVHGGRRRHALFGAGARDRRGGDAKDHRGGDHAGRRLALRIGAGVAAVLVVAGVALAIVLPGGGDEPYARGTLAGATNASGWFTVEQVPVGTRVYLEADALDADAYEVWCIRTDGRWISGGSFRSGSKGSAAATLTAAVEPGDYHEVVVTRGGQEGERGPVVMRGALEY